MITGSFTIYAEFNDSYCTPLSGGSFYLPIQLTQTMDDMGVYLNCDGVFSGATNDGLCEINNNIDPYFNSFKWENGLTHSISGITTSRFKKFLPYGNNELQVMTLSGDCDCGIQDGVKSIMGGKIKYCLDGIEYTMDVEESVIETHSLYQIDDCDTDVDVERRNLSRSTSYSDLSTYNVESEGIWSGNTSLKNLVKTEVLMGYVFEPTISNDVNIDRGRKSIFELHMPFSAFYGIDDIVNFNDNYYAVYDSSRI